jgi:predicted nucleic acid-binding protein
VPLVDTSVWVSHFREGEPRLRDLLEAGEVLCHPFVIGELACGSLRNRSTIPSLMAALPRATVAEHEEVLRFIELHQLEGKGLGYVDVHLLASAFMTGAQLWTFERRLDDLAGELGRRYSASSTSP